MSTTAVALILSVLVARADRLNVIPIVNERQLVLVPATIGILTIANDPNSQDLARQYAALRGIPSKNIIELKLPRADYVTPNIFEREFSNLAARPIYGNLAAFALAFDRPYRVGTDQSITSAIAQGKVVREPSGPCNMTPRNADAGLPAGASLTSKPAMLLSAGASLPDSLALAARGKAADGTDPAGTVLLVKTADVARSQPREIAMDRAAANWRGEIGVRVQSGGEILPRENLVAFQVGLPVLRSLGALQFLPGAFADHLTSFGGALNERRSQTVVSELIRQGATASYGTVREPCNFASKFPDPDRMLGNYLHGDSILEAYWKSVDMPAEGLFIGEPLARPFFPFDAEVTGNVVTVKANRHSAAYMHAGLSQDIGREKPLIRFFAVQSGRPEFLHQFELSGQVTIGQVIGEFSIDSTSLAGGVILGVLAK